MKLKIIVIAPLNKGKTRPMPLNSRVLLSRDCGFGFQNWKSNKYQGNSLTFIWVCGQTCKEHKRLEKLFKINQESTEHGAQALPNNKNFEQTFDERWENWKGSQMEFIVQCVNKQFEQLEHFIFRSLS